MAIDTLLKRRAVIDFGMPSGTRIPSGMSTAFERGTTLGLYYIEPGQIDFGTPTDGWNFGSGSSAWNFENQVSVLEFGTDTTVWSFGD